MTQSVIWFCQSQDHNVLVQDQHLHSLQCPVQWRWAALTELRPRHFVLHLAEHSLAQEGLFISDAVQHWPGNAPAAFPELLWVMLETKSRFYHPLPAPDNHILSADVMALLLSCAGLMENAVKSVLQLSQVKQPHLNPDSGHIGYLSRFPGVYCRSKATQIWSLNLDSFCSSYSHTVQKGICIILLFNGWNKISCMTSVLGH